MNRLKLVLPTPEYKEKLLDYKKEFIENGDILHGTAGLGNAKTEMLALALKECAKLNINQVLITCDKDNVASAKTIINNGSKLENELPEGSGITQRYWISLN